MNPAQLLKEISCRNFNADNDKKGKKWPIFTEKMCLKTTFCEFLGMYELNFSRSSIFHQLWAHIGYFQGKTIDWFFTPFQPLFHRQADFQKL